MTTDHTRDALATATAQNAGIVHALLAIADAIDGGPYVPDAIREAHTPPLVAPELDEDEGPAPEPCAADGGSWVWAGEPGHEYALTNLDSGGDARDLPDVVRHMSPADAKTVVANMTATPHIDARDPKRAERLDHTNPVWRLRALAGNVRRAMSLEPLPVAMTLDQLLDDLEANVDELATSRDNWRSEAEHLGRRS